MWQEETWTSNLLNIEDQWVLSCSCNGTSSRSTSKSKGGACGVMVIVVGNGHGDTSSNPGRDWLHFT